MFTVEDVCERLREQGKKITPQRRLIYRALEGKTSHPTADEIYDEVRVIIPDISLATVYKTLRELVDAKMLVEIKHDNDSSRFDPRTDMHSHLMCVGKWPNPDKPGELIECQRLEDVSTNFPTLSMPDNERQGFQILRNEVIFYGYCPDCQARMLAAS